MGTYQGNPKSANGADTLIALRRGGEGFGFDPDNHGHYAAGRYYADARDAARVRQSTSERDGREAERRAAHASRQHQREVAAAALACERIGRGRYVVTGGAEPHYVDLGAGGAALPLCDCADAHYRPAFACKHVVAARAAEAARRRRRPPPRRVRETARLWVVR